MELPVATLSSPWMYGRFMREIFLIISNFVALFTNVPVNHKLLH
jgi:hypothetical protein